MNEKDFAIVIGISRYDDADRNLSSPTNDARAVAEWLTSETGGGIIAERPLNESSNNCLLLLSEVGKNSQVGEREIRRALLAAAKFSKSHGGRRLYFYFSGHGEAIESNDVLMLHSEYNYGMRHANISSIFLHKDFFNKCCGHFDEVVMWIDCCREHKIRALPSTSMLSCMETARNDQNRIIIYATDHGTFAHEANKKSKTGLSVFTEVLLEGLNHAANDQPRAITWGSINRYLTVNLPLRCQEYHEITQEPHIEIPKWFPTDPIYTTEIKSNLITLELIGFNGELVIRDGPIEVKRINVNKNSLRVKFNLPPKLYEIELPDGNKHVLDMHKMKKELQYEAVKV